MKHNRTFTMIKPDAIENGHSGAILAHIEKAGFKIIAMKLSKLSIEQAKLFYQIHKDRPFFNDLINYITSGPIIAAILKKENAVEDFRKLIGNTNPQEAEEGNAQCRTEADANGVLVLVQHCHACCCCCHRRLWK